MKRTTLFVLFIIAAALVVLTTQIDYGMSTDTRFYFSAAESLIDGRGFYAVVDTHPHISGPFVLWPPLYPALLAGLRIVTNGPPSYLVGMVNLAGALLVLYSLCRLFRSSTALLAVVLVAASPAFIITYRMAWTEPLFLGLVALFLAHATDYWREPSPRSLRWMIAVAILATMTRYTGVTLVAAGFAAIVARKKYRDVVLFGALASLPLSLWLARNYVLTGTLMGPRTSSPYTLADNITLAATGLLGMLVPAILIIFIVWQLIRRAPFPRAVAPTALYAGAYLALLVYTSTTTLYDPIDQRLLSPVLVPVAIMAAAVLQNIRHHVTVTSSTLL